MPASPPSLRSGFPAASRSAEFLTDSPGVTFKHLNRLNELLAVAVRVRLRERPAAEEVMVESCCTHVDCLVMSNGRAPTERAPFVDPRPPDVHGAVCLCKGLNEVRGAVRRQESLAFAGCEAELAVAPPLSDNCAGGVREPELDHNVAGHCRPKIADAKFEQHRRRRMRSQAGVDQGVLFQFPRGSRFPDERQSHHGVDRRRCRGDRTGVVIERSDEIVEHAVQGTPSTTALTARVVRQMERGAEWPRLEGSAQWYWG